MGIDPIDPKAKGGGSGEHAEPRARFAAQHSASVVKREIEQLIREQAKEPEEEEDDAPKPPKPESDPYIEDAKRRLRDALGTKVTLLPKAAGGGTIHVSYHDDEELDRLMNMLAPPR